jgi:hypothetical protein
MNERTYSGSTLSVITILLIWVPKKILPSLKPQLKLNQQEEEGGIKDNNMLDNT